jgi:hypothetical protein
MWETYGGNKIMIFFLEIKYQRPILTDADSRERNIGGGGGGRGGSSGS